MNRLGAASSPYLRQHRDNPVHWHEWGPDAFDEARRRDRPILLSVGYSACHWCHVMAHESFEDPETAELMNALFVNVKVDREERPDVDAIYMDAVQALTGRGGWPMTVFLDPEGRPFYGGTYYPRATFHRLMAAIDEAWRERPGEVASNAEALTEAISRTALVRPADDLDVAALLRGATRALAESHDAKWGGFGGAPKFPSTFALDLLLRAWQERRDDATRDIVVGTLDAMAAGGMNDHFGGGFARYSVDEMWLVPHFEKMLYDQALLARAYLHAWQCFGQDRHRHVLTETIDYVLTTMRDADGGFFSAEDADSLGPDGHSHEGAFYTWTPAEVRDALDGDDDAVRTALGWWDITDGGNFEGRSIPNRIGTPPEDMFRGDDALERLRTRLLARRAERPRPGLDDKVLTEWNAMMLSTLCEAAAATGRDDWRDAAVANGEFLLREMRRDGRWLRSWQRSAEPRARHGALAHDHAHLVDAFTRLYELTGRRRWLDEAREVAGVLIGHFWDHANGGFFTGADDGEQLVVRAKDLLDNAVPSANSVAALAFLRLAALTGDSSLEERARAIIALIAPIAERAPSAVCHLLAAAHLAHTGTTEVAIAGDREDLVGTYRSEWRPVAVLAWGERFDSPLWEGRQDGMAYVCEGHVCRAPVSSPDDLRRSLSPVPPT